MFAIPAHHPVILARDNDARCMPVLVRSERRPRCHVPSVVMSRPSSRWGAAPAPPFTFPGLLHRQPSGMAYMDATIVKDGVLSPAAFPELAIRLDEIIG